MKELLGNLNIDQSLVTALLKEKINIPTEVQRKVILEAIKNKDLVVQSETGTGKTLAYLLPLFVKIDPSKKEMQAIILAPTHELSIQILRQIERLSANSDIKATSTSIIGNVNIDRQIEKLKEKPNIIVGSPGRILELIKKKKISAHTVKTIIIDEADTLMDANNIESVKAVIKSTLKERQLMMFSASISKKTEDIAKEIMKEPDIIRVNTEVTIPPLIDHMYFLSEERDKIDVLRKVIGIMKPQKAMIFIGDKEELEVFSKLKYHGLNVGCIHSRAEKQDRKKAMDEIKNGKIQLLVASDVAARGIDIEGVTHVFNLNIPEKSRDYLHRVGRTGRKGNTGAAVSIITEREMQFVRMYEKELKIKISHKDMFKGNIIEAGKRRV